jgi:ATP-dependent DNA helicase RecG
MLVYGSVNVIRLTKRHCEQDIQTKIVAYEQARQMVDHVVSLISEGSRLLIVCPRKDQKQDEDESEYSIPSVHQVAEKWERLFPGDVRVVHSDTPDDIASNNLDDIKAGRAHILVATTVIECGITINDLRALIVVHAERFGIAQLHQLRGRLSRHGGYGVCYLYIPKPVKDPTMDRLNAVSSTNDGFKLSELDMQLRGVGDLSKIGSKQHGSADSVIFNKQVPIELLAEMIEVLPSKL